jgi:hypothetical protein
MKTLIICFLFFIFSGLALGSDGDLNNDANVTFIDYSMLADEWLKSSPKDINLNTNWDSIRDIRGKKDRTYKILIDSSDYIYAAGRAEGEDGYFLAKYSPDSNTPIWLIDTNSYSLSLDNNGNPYLGGDSVRKYSPDGNLVWEANYPGVSLWHLIATDYNNNVYAVGNYDNSVLAKFDSNGNGPVWVNDYNNLVYDMVIDKNNFIYLAGSERVSKFTSDSNEPVWVDKRGDAEFFSVTTDHNNKIIVTGFDFDIGIITLFKYSPDSNIPLWEAGYSGNVFLPLDIAVDKYDDIYIMGWDYYDINSFTVKYESDGNFVWDRCYIMYPKELVLDSSNNVYVTGNPSIFVDPCDRGVTIVYNTNGDLIEIYDYYGPENNVYEMETIAIDSRDNVYIGGSVGDPNGLEDPNSFIDYNQDYVLVKVKTFLCLPPLKGDCNQDCKVDWYDLEIIVDNWLNQY